jgi:general stress protein 26
MASDLDRVWNLMGKIGFCMLATRDGEAIRSQPMAAYLARDEGAVWFLTDSESHKDEEVQRNPKVCLAFAHAGDHKYVSVSGTAAVPNDRDKIRELWSTPAKAWWTNADDPPIPVLKVTPQEAQYWDSPGTTISYVKMLAATVSNARPAVGDTAKIQLWRVRPSGHRGRTDHPRGHAPPFGTFRAAPPKRVWCSRQSSIRSVTPSASASDPQQGHSGVLPSSIQSVTSAAGNTFRH